MTMQKLRIAVVRGGDTPGYDASLKSGEAVLRSLRLDEARYAPVDIFVDRGGVWHMRGLPTDVASALRHADLVWNASPALHGGERLEQSLEQMRMPYVGSSAMSRALSESIKHSRSIYSQAGLPTIRYALLARENFADADALEIFRTFMHPVSVRASRSPASGIRMAQSFAELENAIRDAFAYSTEAVIEEMKKGKEALVSVIERARGEKLYTLLPAELRGNDALTPGNFTAEEKRRMVEAAKTAHKALGMRHYSDSRFLVTPKQIYILETRALPEFHDDAPLEKSLAATGWKQKDFVDHLIDLAIKTDAPSL